MNSAGPSEADTVIGFLEARVRRVGPGRSGSELPRSIPKSASPLIGLARIWYDRDRHTTTRYAQRALDLAHRYAFRAYAEEASALLQRKGPS